MRFPLEVAEAVRRSVPDDLPIFYRISSVDGIDGGWTITDDLIPLCIPCHQFKHLEIWIPTLAEGRAVIWRHAVTGKVIITWP